jgi:hypothetical protein
LRATGQVESDIREPERVGCLQSERVGANTLQELRELNVSNNTLKTLPASVGYLSKLESLKIGANRLKRLPLEVLEMRDLEELQVGCSPAEARVRGSSLRVRAFHRSPSVDDATAVDVRIRIDSSRSLMFRRALESSLACHSEPWL